MSFNTDGEGNMFKAFMEVMMSSVIQQTEIGSYLQQDFFPLIFITERIYLGYMAK